MSPVKDVSMMRGHRIEGGITVSNSPRENLICLYKGLLFIVSVSVIDIYSQFIYLPSRYFTRFYKVLQYFTRFYKLFYVEHGDNGKVCGTKTDKLQRKRFDLETEN